jgi:GR25 family glycosyltransferase involved in LPS biosynthesis
MNAGQATLLWWSSVFFIVALVWNICWHTFLEVDTDDMDSTTLKMVGPAASKTTAVEPTMSSTLSDRTAWYWFYPSTYRKCLLRWLKLEVQSDYLSPHTITQIIPDLPPLTAQTLRGWPTPVSVVSLGMSHRRATHFLPLRQRLQKQQIHVDFRPGIDGKHIPFQDLKLAPRYLHFFEKNQQQREQKTTTVDYRGHLGCTLAHLCALSEVQHTTLVLEDDAVIPHDLYDTWPQRLQEMEALDPTWDVLLLGFCCRYSDHASCKSNDHEPIRGHIAKINYFFGGWAYVVHDRRAAARLLHSFDPISWHIDLTMAEQAHHQNLRIYGCVPPLINHPGSLRISSFDQECLGLDVPYTTDTNH